MSSHSEGSLVIDSATSHASGAAANQALIERGYDAFARGDIPTVLQVLAEDILFRMLGALIHVRGTPRRLVRRRGR
jgi:ketosteroid isomerase-like protein